MLIASAVLIARQVKLDKFDASSNGTDITVKWQAFDESGVASYEIERSIATPSAFKKITSKKAEGSGHLYTYIDRDAYLKDKSKKDGNPVLQDNVYSYRLKIIFDDDSYTYSNQVNVTHKTSNIRRTWGMIKEMFK